VDVLVAELGAVGEGLGGVVQALVLSLLRLVPETMQCVPMDIEPMEKAKVEGKEKKMVAVVVEAPGAHKESKEEEMMVNIHLLLVQVRVATKSKSCCVCLPTSIGRHSSQYPFALRRSFEGGLSSDLRRGCRHPLGRQDREHEEASYPPMMALWL